MLINIYTKKNYAFGILQRGAGADQRGLGSTPLIINFSRLLEAKFKLNPGMKENRLNIFKLTSKLFKSAVKTTHLMRKLTCGQYPAGVEAQ